MHTLTCDSGRNVFGMHRDRYVDNSADNIWDVPRQLGSAFVSGVDNLSNAHKNAAVARMYYADKLYMEEVAEKVSDVNGRLDEILEKLKLIVPDVSPGDLHSAVDKRGQNKTKQEHSRWNLLGSRWGH